MDIHPCGICKVHVLETDEAVQCDGLCSLWHHRECLGMTLDIYLKLSRGQEDWLCRKCTKVKTEIKQEFVEERARPRQKDTQMGKTKVECKKLDFLTETQKCVFCGTSEIDEMKYGPVYSHKNIITHYYCLLLSSNMEQNGRDSDGILGFLPNDISREVKRGSRLHCSYCRSNGATLGCAVAKCKVVFHLPCGMKHSTLHQFFGEFKSYCNKHRPVQSISEKILANSSKGAICGICYDKVIPRPVHDTLWAPCCQKNAFFHRVCVQRLAVSAGYFFKCPLCNNTTLFQQTMKEFGIYIPEQDASWECVPHAYQDLLVRHDTCDSANCSCPEGRKTNVVGTRWELILCKYCGSQGTHIGCGRLKWKSPEFECNTCSKASQEGNERSSGSRHRLVGSHVSADVHPSVSTDRDKEDSDESSIDSADLTISKRKMRICSPVSGLKTQSPPLYKSRKKHRHEMYENKHDKEMKHENNSSILIDDDLEEKLISRSILIDDSDDDVEFVPEPKINFNQSNSTSLKTVDGMTIPVVQVDSKAVQARKRFRAVGDIDIDSAEVVDIAIQMPGPVKKEKIPSPPPIKELFYTFPQLQPQPSSSQSLPSASFAPPDFSRYLLVDSSTLRPEDLVPGTVVYRSIQPLVQTIPQQGQPPLQPQPQCSSMPMQQQLGSSSNADAQYSDLSEHWARSSYHFDSYTNTYHNQECTKKAPRRTVKCDSAGRRRGRHPRCDNNRLNPQVVISRLRYRISSSGHFEFIVPCENLNSMIFLKKKAALPFRPMKKIKLLTIKKSSKSKLLEKAIPPATINTPPDKAQEKIIKNKHKSQSKKTIKVKISSCSNREITNFYNPTKVKTVRKKNKKTSEHCIDYPTKRNKKDKNCGIGFEMKDSANNISSKTECKGSKMKKRRLNSPEQWKFATIDKYLMKIKNISTFQNDTNQQHFSNHVVNFEQKLSFVPMKSEKVNNDIEDTLLYISKEETLISEGVFDDTMFSSDKCQANTINDENSYSLEYSESSSKQELENIEGPAFSSSKNETSKCEIYSGLNWTESSFKHNKSGPHMFINPALNSSKTVDSEHEYNLNLTDSNYQNSTILLDNGTSLDNRKVLPIELLKHGYVNTNMNESAFVLPPKTGLMPSTAYSSELTNSNIRNSPWSWTKSSFTLSSDTLEIELSLGEGSELKHSLANMKHNDSVLVQCYDGLVAKSSVEPSSSNLIKSITNEHTLVSNKVNKYKKNTLNKETEDSLLNSDVEQKAPLNLKPYDLHLSHDESATRVNSSCKAAIHSAVKDSMNSNSIVESYRLCGELCQDTITKKNVSNELNEMACPHSGNGNNYQKQVNDSLFRSQGFFPKIKLRKSAKVNVLNKKCSNSEIKLKHLNKYKCDEKLHKENMKKIQLHTKRYEYVNKGMYSLDYFFTPTKKELSSTSKAANSSNTPRSDTSDAILPPLPSKTVNTNSPTKSKQRPLCEIKLNTISNCP